MKNDYIATGQKRSKKVMLPNFFSGQNTKFDESVLPVTTAKSIVNFDFSSGALTQGYGLIENEFNIKNVMSAWTYRRYDESKKAYTNTVMYADNTGVIFRQNDEGAFVPLGLKVEGKPYTVNYRLYGKDAILICTESDGMFVWNYGESVYKVESSPKITSLCIHYERMFCSGGDEKNCVWFSDDLDPTNWSTSLTEGGFIQMLDERGNLNKVLSYLNYVYIFRDYGISRLTAYAEQSEFLATNLYVASGKIYPESVTVCGDTIMFLANDGLYAFDGVGTRRVLGQLDNFIVNSPLASAAYFDGKYFLSLKVNFNGEDSSGNGNNALLVYDVKGGGYSILDGVDIRGFAVLDDACHAIGANNTMGKICKCGEIFGVPTKKVFKSAVTDFNTDEIKTVREVYIDADAPLMLTVTTEKGSKRFPVVPNNGLTCVKVNLAGRKIGFTLESDEKLLRISRPSIRLAVRR